MGIIYTEIDVIYITDESSSVVASYLTPGKWYKTSRVIVISKTSSIYHIIDDDGDGVWVRNNEFLTVDIWREKQINKVLV